MLGIAVLERKKKKKKSQNLKLIITCYMCSMNEGVHFYFNIIGYV